MQSGQLICPTCQSEDQPITVDVEANNSSAPADTSSSIIVIDTKQVEDCTRC